MRLGRHEISSLFYASVFAVAIGIALHFFARVPTIIALLSAGILFAACLIALLANKR